MTTHIPSMQDLLRAALKRAAVDADALVLRNADSTKLSVAIHPPGDAFPVSTSLLADVIRAGYVLAEFMPPNYARSEDPEIEAVYRAMERAVEGWIASVEALDASMRGSVQ